MAAAGELKLAALVPEPCSPWVSRGLEEVRRRAAEHGLSVAAVRVLSGRVVVEEVDVATTGLVVLIRSGAALAEAAALLPGLRFVHSWIAGMDGFREFMADERWRHVALSNSRKAFSSSLAEYALAAALHFNKRIPHLAANKAAQRWEAFTMPELRGGTMVFIGYGDIAQATARLARAFGMKVLAVVRNAQPRESYGEVPDEVCSSADEEAVSATLARADFAVCSLPRTPATEHYVSAKRIGYLPPHSVFISIGRGSPVDQKALAAALESGALAGAALDVFEEEPLPVGDGMWNVENLLISSHNADLVQRYHLDAGVVFEKNLANVLRGQPLYTPVDKEAGY